MRRDAHYESSKQTINTTQYGIKARIHPSTLPTTLEQRTQKDRQSKMRGQISPLKYIMILGFDEFFITGPIRPIHNAHEAQFSFGRFFR